MSSLYRQDLIRLLLQETRARHYSVASKARRLTPRPLPSTPATKPAHEQTRAPSTPSSTLPQPNPPPLSPPPSWRFPFPGRTDTLSKDKTVDTRSGAVVDESLNEPYDLSKQASWSDPPLVARARSKTVKQRNVLESYLGELQKS